MFIRLATRLRLFIRLLTDAGYGVLKAPNGRRDLEIAFAHQDGTKLQRRRNDEAVETSPAPLSQCEFMTIREFCGRYSIGRRYLSLEDCWMTLGSRYPKLTPLKRLLANCPRPCLVCRELTSQRAHPQTPARRRLGRPVKGDPAAQ
jgi:hypothetical protein